MDWFRPNDDQPNYSHKPSGSTPRLGTPLTTSPLAAAATWTSSVFEVANLARIELAVEVLQEGKLYVETSLDLANWLPLTAPTRIRQGFNSLWVGVSQPYVRFRYVNGSEHQTFFHLRLFDPRSRLRRFVNRPRTLGSVEGPRTPDWMLTPHRNNRHKPMSACSNCYDSEEDYE